MNIRFKQIQTASYASFKTRWLSHMESYYSIKYPIAGGKIFLGRLDRGVERWVSNPRS
jgi:hypothetical protein